MKYSILPILALNLIIVSLCSCTVNNAKESSVKEDLVQQVSLVSESAIDSGRSIAITIDDLPGVSLLDYREVTSKLLATLKRYQVPAIGFVNEGKLYPKGKLDQGRLDLLAQWLEAGMELGNHTYSHGDYNNLTFEQFISDLLKGEKHTKLLQSDHGQSMKYFRHPYLHVGNTAGKKEQLEQYLAEHEYESAPVTIDNSEWIFAKAYQLSLKKNDAEKMEQIGDAYVKYMKEMTVFYEKQSVDLFGRPIKHTLLIHANALNADYLDDLLEMYEERDYHFISLEEALRDTAYETKDNYVGKGGISWLHRWAISQNIEKSFFAGEPTCPEFIQTLAGFKE